MSDLVLGPLLRYVDERSASVWVETARPATVTVVAGDHRAEAATFTVHDHHYALVCLDDLEPGFRQHYRVEVDGTTVWPDPDPEVPGLPDPMIVTLEAGKPLRL